MAILNQKRILNLIPKVSAPVTIHVSQGDVGTQIEFTLVKGDEVFVNPGNVTASVHGVREDGANFGPFTCNLSGSKVTFPLHSEMTAVKGSALAEIVLVDNGGNKVGSANFGILVEESVFPLGVTYDNDVSVYESILAYAQSSAAQITASLSGEISARTNADTLINTRIDEIIAPSGEAPNPTEIVDARIGADGVVHSNLGTAIRAQIEDITSMPNLAAGSNRFNIERWLLNNNITYTKNDDAYSFTTSPLLLNNPYKFSNEDCEVTLSATITAGTSSNPKLQLLDSSNNVVGEITTSIKTVTATASKIRLSWGSGGTLTVANPLIIDGQYSNERLTEIVRKIDYKNLHFNNIYAGEELVDLEEWLINSGMTYTKSDNSYTVNINAYGNVPQQFAPEDIDVELSVKITPGTASKPMMLIVNSNGEAVGIVGGYGGTCKVKGCKLQMSYGSAGTVTFSEFRLKSALNSVSELTEKTKTEIDKLYKVVRPSEFTWNNSVVENKIYTDGKNNFYLKNFDIRNYKNVDNNKKTYYVNANGGSDSYSGLDYNRPLASIKAAYDKTDVGTIILSSGNYYRDKGFWKIFEGISKDINIIGIGDVYITNTPNRTWSSDPTHSSTYVTSVNQAPLRIIDINRIDPNTDCFITLEEVSSVTDVYNTNDTWYYDEDNGILYVHVYGSVMPSLENGIVVSHPDSNAHILGACTVYLENIKFIGGNTPIRINNTSNTDIPTVYAKDCEFWYGDSRLYGNAVTVQGANTIFEHCKAMCNGHSDGFNYHTYNDVISKAVEINCVGMYNGDSEDGSDQGSTMHEGGKIIRINGVYAYNQGANVAEEGGAESWNLGCVCFGSESIAPSQNGNYMAYTDTKLWIDGCIGYASTGNLAGRLENVHLRNVRFEGELKSPSASGEPTYY